MKKTVLFLCMFPIVAFARPTIGIGEYRYGPNTPQNVACQIAEERAKEDAINRFMGEHIESAVSENCKNGDCELDRVTYSESQGTIRKIIAKSDKRVEETGYTSCVVTVNADVVHSVNTIKLSLEEKYFNLKEFEKVQFRGTVNKPGHITMFNFYGGNYHRLYHVNIASNAQDFVIPSSKHSITATLPKGVKQSKELVLFLFTETPVELREKYTENEMRILLSTLPFDKRKYVSRYVNIMR
jgi:hypothetical protein